MEMRRSTRKNFGLPPNRFGFDDETIAGTERKIQRLQEEIAMIKTSEQSDSDFLGFADEEFDDEIDDGARGFDGVKSFGMMGNNVLLSKNADRRSSVSSESFTTAETKGINREKFDDVIVSKI